MWNFVDEKHFLNGDPVPNKLRVNPVNGTLACMSVSGNFREALNMMACVSVSFCKPKPVSCMLL